MGGELNATSEVEILRKQVEDLEILLAQAHEQIEALTKRKRKVISTPEMESAFEKFWELYPRKVGKGAAKKAFFNHGCHERLTQIVSSLTTQKTWPDWIRDGGKYIPHPSTWLNQQRWEDEGTKTERFTQSW